jgi:hypothetical protein
MPDPSEVIRHYLVSKDQRLSVWSITPAAYLEHNKERDFELIDSFHTRAEAQVAKEEIENRSR